MRSVSTLLLVVLVAAPATAGSIHGRVRVPPLSANSASFSASATRDSSVAPTTRGPRGLVTDAVIFVESLPAGVRTPPHALSPQLAQREQSFEPRVVVVPAGGTVDFPNFDPVFHDVYSVSPVRRFELGKYPRGQSRHVAFPRAGLVNVSCKIHPEMAAFILVVPNPAWARPGTDGEYQLSGLPPGHYRLHWWHPDLPTGASDVEVPASGDVALDVTFRWRSGSGAAGRY